MVNVYTKVTSGMEMKMARGRFLRTETGVSVSIPGTKIELYIVRGPWSLDLHLPRGWQGHTAVCLSPKPLSEHQVTERGTDESRGHRDEDTSSPEGRI